MDSLQTRACHSFLERSSLGAEVPHDTPGSQGSWVQSWAKCVGLVPENNVVDVVRECLERGSSYRLRVSRAFTEEVRALSETMDMSQVTSRCDGNKASEFNDITLSTPSGWTWRVKNFLLLRRRIREEKQKEVDFQRRYRVVKQDVVEIMGDIRRCEDWEDKLEYILWGEIRSLIECLPRGMRKKYVGRLQDDGILDDGFEL